MSALAPLRHRTFRLLVTGRTVNALGSAFAPIALAFAVLDSTGSVCDLGFVVGARTLANVAFLLFGGVLADRLRKDRLMVGASLTAAVTQGVTAALVLDHAATVPLLVVLAGPISRLARIGPTLVGAAGPILVAVFGMLSSRDVRTLRHELPKTAAEPMEQSVG